MPDDPIRFHRWSIRLKEYDYTSPGAYFVTVVAHQRACLFGKVIDGGMQLNAFGAIANDEWLQTEKLRPFIHVYPEEFVVMPNHIHGIIWIDEMETNNGRGAASLRPYGYPFKQSDVRYPKVFPNSLGAIVRAYKSTVTYRINGLRNSRGMPVWQRNYNEHIIRDQSDLESIAGYIRSNPDHWSDDTEYTQ